MTDPWIEAGDEVGVVLVQPDGGAEVGLRPLHPRPRHLDGELFHVLDREGRAGVRDTQY